MSRDELVTQLEAEKENLRRCMGGVDPVGAVAASKRISGLRIQLRDDARLFEHFAKLTSSAS